MPRPWLSIINRTFVRYFRMTVSESSPQPQAEGQPKLQGRELYKAMGSPRTIVAPMVDQSELAWRILSRRYGAELCYTPMFHARLFHEDEKYYNDMFSELDGDPKIDRPLIVQFCANDPDHLLKAAKRVVGRCDAVDLNIGCPQGIAKRGKYGAYLMEDWDLIYRLINKLHNELEIPVTAKIRIYDDKEKTLRYAKHVLSAGAQFLTVHGRTREMKGQNTGLADWETIRYLRDNLPPNTVMFSNGNMLYSEDINNCLEATNTDACMSAEGNLHNPGIFNIDKDHVDDRFPRVDKLLREYFEIAKTLPGNASKSAMKSHFFKMLRAFLPHHTDIRNLIGATRKGEYEKYENVVKLVEERVTQIYSEGKLEDVIVDDGKYKDIPYWRSQPYVRDRNAQPTIGKRKLEDDDPKPNKKQEQEQKQE